jgi:hypothetical protein
LESSSNTGRRAVVVAIALLVSGGAGLRAEVPATASGAPRPSSDMQFRFGGLPLAEALNRLKSQGLRLIFSSDLVRPDMRVASEPGAKAPRLILDEILAPFGLAALNGPGGTILVVRDPAAHDPGTAGGDGVGSGDGAAPVAERPALHERIRVDAPPDGGPAAVTSMGQETIASLPVLGDDATRALASLPGITSAETSARFSVRGGAGNDALILLDGLEIDEPYHLQDFFAFSSILDSRAIGRMDIMTGVFPAEYGDRTSGVVDMSSSDATGPPRTAIGLSLINTSLLSSGGLENGGSWLVSARTWRPDDLVDTFTMQGDGLNPSYGDLFGKVEVPLPGGSILAAHVLAARDDLRYRSNFDDGRVAADDDHRYAWLTWKTPWTPRLYSETVVSSSRAARGRSGGSTEGQNGVVQVDDDRSYGSYGLKQDWMFAAGERALLKWGFDARRVEAEYDYRSHMDGPVPVDRDLSLDPSGLESGAYLAGRFQVLAPLSVEVGVRRDRQSLTHETETSPRVNVACRVGEGDLLRAGWGVFHQPQGINELQVEDGVTRFFPAQSAEQWDVGFDHRLAEGMMLGVSAYHRAMSSVRPYYENLFDPFQLFPEDEPDRVRVAPDASLMRGVELTLARDLGKAVSWRASYALASSEDRIDGAWVPRSWDQRHTFDFNLTWRHGSGWEFGMAGVYHTGWPTTDVTATQIPGAGGVPVIEPVLGTRDALRYPPYHRVDVGVTRRIPAWGGMLGFRFQVMNVYGRANVCCVDDFQYQPLPDGSVRVNRVEGTWPRQLPVFAITFEF